jgi:hypothetical protein
MIWGGTTVTESGSFPAPGFITARLGKHQQIDIHVTYNKWCSIGDSGLKKMSKVVFGAQEFSPSQ